MSKNEKMWANILVWGIVGGIVAGPVGAGIGAGFGASLSDTEESKPAPNPEYLETEEEDVSPSVSISIRAIEHSQFREGIRGFKVSGQAYFIGMSNETCHLLLNFWRGSKDKTITIKTDIHSYQSDWGEYFALRTNDFTCQGDNCTTDFEFFVPYGSLRITKTSNIRAVVFANNSNSGTLLTYEAHPFKYFVYESDPRESAWNGANEQEPSSEKQQTEQSPLNVITAIVGYIISSERPINRLEVRAFKSFLEKSNSSQQEMDLAKEFLKRYVESPPTLNYIESLFQNTSAQDKITILAFGMNVAYSAGIPSESKKCAIRNVGDKIGISPDILDKMFHDFQGFEDEYYKRLELRRGASQEELKTAYREKCKEFHPDKYQGLPKSFQDFAKVEFQKVQEAFDYFEEKIKNGISL